MIIPQELDYSQSQAWFHLPDVSENNKEADVLFVHGTVLHDEGKIYLDPSKDAHRKLPLRPHMGHASCYRKNARLFHPHYRQLSLEGHFDGWDFVCKAYTVPVRDIYNAIQEYLKLWNNGRPFILAGNSQGAIVLREVIKLMAKEGPLPSNLVAAYLIGCTVKKEELSEMTLPIATSATDFPCIISYNTLALGAKEGLTLFPPALCVNPLNWKQDSTYAGKECHLGRVDISPEGEVQEYPQFTDAWIDEEIGALIVNAYTKENAPPRKGFPQGDLHTYNHAFFYRNIEQNVCDRIKAYIEKKKV